MPRGLCSRPAVISLALWASPLFAWAAPADAPVAVRVTIQAGQALRNMRGGIGASWHAIGTELPGKKPDSGGSYSGSAWGANPDPADDKAWQQLYAHANWLGLDWCSVEIEQRMYQPGRRRFSWDNRDMRALYRILDWAEQNGVDVFLQQMWANVEWNAYPGLE